MTNPHPITPSPELVQEWCHKWTDAHGEFGIYLATQASRWGADTELEACVEWLWKHQYDIASVSIRAARRPKPPSPKEEALQVLENLLEARRIVDPEYQALRHALEQLDDH